ncbi:MAG TPA: hypothetical protein VIV07_09070 [Sphingomicrobium sp.]
MRKSVTALVVLSILSTSAAAQVRPGDCRPVLPVTDKVVADVVTEQAPVTTLAKRKFLGLPFLLPLLLGGGCLVLCHNGGGGTPNTPPPPPPVSPA